MKVLAKITVEKGLHARPNQIRPLPPTLQFTNAKPLSSSLEALPCALTAPFIHLDPGLAIDINSQFCASN